MSSQPHIVDMNVEEKKNELKMLGYEKESNSIRDCDSTSFSSLLGRARQNRRIIYAGLFILPGCEQNLEDVRPSLLNLNRSEHLTAKCSSTSGQEERITFTRLSETEQHEKLQKQCTENRVLLCPRCDKPMHQYYQRNTSDGMCGIQYADHMCTDLTCGLCIERYYEGYGSIFDDMVTW